MTDTYNTITVKVLDREFKVKCPIDKVSELQKSARHLDSKMREIRDTSDIHSIDGYFYTFVFNYSQIV